MTFARTLPTHDPDEYPLMTAAEVAAKLGISVKNLMEHVHTGRMRSINVGTVKRKSYRFTPKNLRTFIENQKERAIASCKGVQTEITKSNSSTKASGFSGIPRPKTARKQRPSNEH